MDTTENREANLSKKDAILHLLHCSIRLHFIEEDPFSNHLIIQSCNKLISDMVKQTKEKPKYDINEYLTEEGQRIFWKYLRRPYNFLKHADRDYEDQLFLKNIIVANELMIMFNILGSQDVDIPNTKHASLFIAYFYGIFPSFFDFVGTPHESAIHHRETLQLKGKSRQVILLGMRQIIEDDQDILREREQEKKCYSDGYNTPIHE